MAPEVKDIKMGQLTAAVKELNELLFEPGDKNRMKTVGVSKADAINGLKEMAAILNAEEGDKISQTTADLFGLLEIQIPEGVGIIGSKPAPAPPQTETKTKKEPVKEKKKKTVQKGDAAKRNSFISDLVKTGKLTAAEIITKVTEKFPGSSPSTVKTILYDSKNPKYNRLEQLTTQDKEGKFSFAK